MYKVGDCIDNQYVVHEIKEGGMGVVYIVYDLVQRIPLAAKTMKLGLKDDDTTAAQRFIQEARLWLELERHENVAQAHFVEQVQGRPFIFLEYVSGGSLREVLQTDVLRGDIEYTLRLALNLCDGMSHAYSKGLGAHRDLKPENCLVTEDGVLKITDFGLARTVFDEQREFDSTGNSVDMKGLSDANAGRLTETDGCMGTPPYMAPEQFIDVKNACEKADIYAFGIMLFEMLTGRLPFLARSVEAYAWHHIHAKPPRPNTSYEKLGRLATQCIAKSAANRPDDFDDIRRTVSELYRQYVGVDAPPAVEGAPLESEEHVDKGIGLRALRRYSEAIDSFDRALTVRSTNSRALVNKGACLSELGRHQEALRNLELALRIDPDREVAWANKGLVFERLGETAVARKCVSKALAINPRNARTVCNLAASLAQAGKLGDALMCIDRAIHLFPDHAAAWVNRGGVLEMLERPEEALDSFETALNINGNLEIAAMGCAEACARLGRLEDASRWYSEVLRINPTNVTAVARKAELLAAEGEYRDEIDCYEQYLALRSADPRMWTNKGVAHATLNEHAQAVECFDRAIELAPDFADGWYNKGVSLLDPIGDVAAARKCFRAAERLGHPRARAAQRRISENR